MDDLDTTSTANPLNGYTVAIQTAIDVASGKSKSRLRLDAAMILLEHCAQPPWVEWDFEQEDESAA